MTDTELRDQSLEEVANYSPDAIHTGNAHIYGVSPYGYQVSETPHLRVESQPLIEIQIGSPSVEVEGKLVRQPSKASARD